jgi:hypothetical protein
LRKRIKQEKENKMDLLTINKRDSNADEEKGPSVEATNAEERIEARRLRIKKKNDASQK